ncbi:hypothetical protein WA158_000269 [Blastocystis sp. Blastoise]
MKFVLICVLVLVVLASPSVDCQSKPQADYPYCNPELSIDERVDDLVDRMTLDEAIYQTWSVAPGIERLGMKAYNWRANCLHGWSASGGKWYDLKWNAFPAPIGLGAMFDLPLTKKVAIVTGNEGRALHNILLEKNNGSILEATSLNCFSPNVNLFRDPRWGRGQETFGEDPYLIAMIGAAYTEGLQQKSGKYYNVAACAKHYAVHSGPDNTRLSFVAKSTEHDLYDTYFPQFETQARCVNVLQMMPAYSGIETKESPERSPDAANKFLLQTTLRERWERPDINIISDNGGVEFTKTQQHYVDNFVDSAAICMNASTDLDLGNDKIYPKYLPDAVKQNKTKESTIRESVKRSMKLRMLVGDFDPKDKVEYQNWGYEHLNTQEYKDINLLSTQKSIVLSRNRVGVLPTDFKQYKQIGIVGNNADNGKAYLSNYEGIPDHIYTVKESMETYCKENGLPAPLYAPGCIDSQCIRESYFPAVMEMAEKVDVVIAVMGLDMNIEGESHDRVMKTCKDQPTELLGLPGCQGDLVKQLHDMGKTVILVLVHGAPITVPNYADTVIDAFYPGQFGGQAIVDVITGKYNPAGRLPYTILKEDKNMLGFDDYDFVDLPGRTYKYYRGEIQFPFGHGLSYSTFNYNNMKISASTLKPCKSLTLSVTVHNNGPFDGDEVIQVYVSTPSASFVVPIRQLYGFSRVFIKNGDDYTFEYTLDALLMSVVNDDGKRVVLPGDYSVYIGGGQPGYSSGISSQFSVEGSVPTLIDECPKEVPRYFCADFANM